MEWITLAVNCVLLVLIGIIGFFLKQYILSLADHIRLCNTKHVEIGQLQTEIKNMTELFRIQFANLNETIRTLRDEIANRPADYRKAR